MSPDFVLIRRVFIDKFYSERLILEHEEAKENEARELTGKTEGEEVTMRM
jgi:hypothetical protein